MKKSTVRVVVANPGSEPIVREIENSLEALQSLVGGYVEALNFDTMTIYINEEGRMRGMPFNRFFAGIPVVGPIVVTGCDEEGETISLSPRQVDSACCLLALN